ncbi:poly(R)-hydroxyalkanoic acid synthase subunit PhaE [Frateuria hangzhouensis]|uniref:poly(R)-hydroxyalkanoic acid synthase subunit PhaE n=1 Tax=Frateuria hangzhouensis TaxID=2995589 RepID=UPI002260D866|nr:poly(R)-hydroxyalkanoic acid synthase subunit PhaE [Frateuria sp. STR12]MCX7512435.1 pha synthase subunit protein [Frateuria sp. STR12]
MTAQNPATDFETLGRQVWEAWAHKWPGSAVTPAAEAVPGMDGLKGYLEWMQQATATMTGQGTQVPPPVPPFTGWAMPAMGAPPAGLDASRGLLDTPAFGYTREQQAQQQALMRALLDHQQANARYQQLVGRAQAEGMARAQRQLAEPGLQIDSLKAMYDLWVDAVEEAYAEIALSDEFREVYAAQANTQMRVRQLQQQQIEQWCREMGLPTRSEVDTLGQRLQELRRELRRMRAAAGAPSTDADKVTKAAKRATAAARPSTRPKTKPAAKAGTRRASRKPR